jgi:hypothetical protein
MRTALHITPRLGRWESDYEEGNGHQVIGATGCFAQTGIPVYEQFYAQTGSRRPLYMGKSLQAQKITGFYAQTGILYKKDVMRRKPQKEQMND